MSTIKEKIMQLFDPDNKKLDDAVLMVSMACGLFFIVLYVSEIIK